ncbi:MAG: M64 family metallopeptidase [Prevotellaceae bacterium]|nr:IgA Peptidase M64 [Prevotella sp.]MDD7257218.1 M64 family metallopeptidase [Prevotellaceae bacterium]MDY6130678.1 M64 family metallopeptidase [Prevotella sp.]
MKRTVMVLSATIIMVANAFSQEFDRFFTDKTLRIDYAFSGDAVRQDIFVDKLNVVPRWYGKKKRLAEVPVEGNGQIVVKDHKSQQVIYRNSFSTLFQEWLSYDEAKIMKRSFENVFLVPMPKDTIDVTVTLMNNQRKAVASLTHMVVPSDILIRRIGEHGITPFEILRQAADTTRCIHIAFVAEGYQESEMPIFLQDARIATEAIFQHEPFKSMQNRFHIVAVKSPSKDSGTSEPAKGIWKNTTLHSHFDTFYSSRYLTTLNLKDLHDRLAGIPYEHIIVLVNTDNYGGGGILNSYNLSMTHHRSFRPVVVHEFGHSFAGLADEYAYENEAIPMYPYDIEPWEPNITTLKDFHGKWENMIDKKTPVPTPATEKHAQKVGLYEGAGYSLKGVYRGMQDCRMRTNEHPEFCPVCRQAIARLINFYTE